MRVLLVSGSRPEGGSYMSTHAFGRALLAAGHDVVGLVRSFDHPHRDRVHEQLVDASVKAPAPLARVINAADSTLGRRAGPVAGLGYPVWSTAYPEHALPRLLRLFEPEVIVGNSIGRVSWRRCSALARRAGVRTALHLREANAIGHLVVSKELPDVLLANAESLAEAARGAGQDAFVVPSVVELERCTVESSRRVALLVNPRPEFGLEVALSLAAARPDVPFVLQESLPLDDDLPALERRLAPLPNVELRRRRSPADVYSDARVLLVPHRIVNRPRVILEAQHNGIPVVASDLGGLREAVGTGGILVPADAPPSEWEDAFDRAWNDPSGQLQARARAHAARPGVQPAAVVAAFEEAMASVGLGGRASLAPITSVAPAPDSDGDHRLGLSVVVPAHDAEPTLGQQLDALLAQQWDQGFEVIVVDNLSTDSTTELVRGRMGADPRLRLVSATGGRGAAYARNAGVAAARAAAVAFCDADDVVSDGWVKAMGEALRDHALVAGTVNVEALNPPGAARSRGGAIAEGPGRFGPVPFAHGCNMGVRKRWLEAVGGWDASVRTGEDVELCLRLWRRGVELHYEPAAEVRYRIRSDESGFWRQAVRYGAAHVDLARRLEVRQIPGPSRLHGLRNLAWLVRHAPDVADPNRRPHWIWTAGLSTGHLLGSLRWRMAYP